jgi:hypothetical protein
MLHMSAATTQVPAAQAGKVRALPRRKVGGPAPKKVKASVPQAPPPPPPMNNLPPAPPSADPSGAHMVFDEVPER